MLPNQPGGHFTHPVDPSRLQGGLCGNRLIISPRAWDLLTDGPPDPHKVPAPDLQLRWNDAKSICRACQILPACRKGGLDQKLGVWGGLDQHERHNMRKAAARKASKERAERPAGEPETAPRAVPEPVPAAAPLKREFPVEDPPAHDGWIRDRKVVRSAFYIAQTSDGKYMRMKIKGDHYTGLIKWYPAEDVDLRRAVDVTVQSWAGRPGKKERDGVQGTAEAA